LGEERLTPAGPALVRPGAQRRTWPAPRRAGQHLPLPHAPGLQGQRVWLHQVQDHHVQGALRAGGCSALRGAAPARRWLLRSPCPERPVRTALQGLHCRGCSWPNGQRWMTSEAAGAAGGAAGGAPPPRSRPAWATAQPCMAAGPALLRPSCCAGPDLLPPNPPTPLPTPLNHAGHQRHPPQDVPQAAQLHRGGWVDLAAASGRPGQPVPLPTQASPAAAGHAWRLSPQCPRARTLPARGLRGAGARSPPSHPPPASRAPAGAPASRRPRPRCLRRAAGKERRGGGAALAAHQAARLQVPVCSHGRSQV
jgi:hypothetical protein